MLSMLAFWALSVSCLSTGSAYALISRSRPLPFGYVGTDTLVILPSATVMLTWTGPQRVSATEPWYVVPPDDVVVVVLVACPGSPPDAAAAPAEPVPIVLVR